MEEWKEYKIEDICEQIFAGGDAAKYSSSKHQTPLYNIPIYANSTESEGLYGYCDKAVVSSPAVTIAARGAGIGFVAFRNKPFVPIVRLITLITNNLVDTKFLYYYLKNRKLSGDGSAIPQITVPMVKKEIVTVPILEEQKRIANILSSLDDKIELNRRINDNLEQQAQALFKSWFVDFEPFKNSEFVDDDFGRRPFGWSVKPLKHLVEKVKSGDWGKDEQTGNYTMRTFCMRGTDFPDIKEGSKGKMPIRYILEKNFKEKCLCNGNVVVEISGGSPTQSTGRIVLVDKTFIADCDNALICTNFCKSLEIKEGFSAFFFLLWQYLYDQKVMFVYENGSNGLKNLNINSLIERELFVIPPKNVISRFNLAVAPLLSKKQTNGVEVARLVFLRDTLLPKLMSGELEISEIKTKHSHE